MFYDYSFESHTINSIAIYLMYFVLVQSRLSFQVLPTSPTENSSDANTEPVDEPLKEDGVEDQMKNISFLSKTSAINPEETLKVSVPQADYMLGIAGKNLKFRF